ncbi:hypothetical protein GCM10020331_006640 [Ectobacillus funiculus]
MIIKKLYGQQTFLPEMKEDQQIIQNVTGQHSNLVRAPYGSMPGLNKALRDQVADAQLKLWDWTIDSLDWKYNQVPLNQSVPAIVNLVVSQSTKDKEVILLHDIHAQSVQAVPLIIQKKLKEQGYEFEAYDEKEHFIVNFLARSKIVEESPFYYGDRQTQLSKRRLYHLIVNKIVPYQYYSHFFVSISITLLFLE